MKDILSVSMMKKSEKYTIDNGISSRELMKRAGEAIFDSYNNFGKTAIVCGKGNNAGDGYSLATVLYENKIPCKLFLIEKKFSEDGGYFFDKCMALGIEYELCSTETDFSSFDTIVDCIFGIGFKGSVDEFTGAIIDAINLSGKYVICADINSGLNADNGMAEKCVISDLTVSIGFLKTGHVLNMAKDKIKRLINCNIGISLFKDSYKLLQDEDFKGILEKRDNFSHKGDYGTVGIMGGCLEYSGAVRLANLSSSALCSGCGISRVIVPERIAEITASSILESTLFPIKDDDGSMIFDKLQIAKALSGLKALAVGMGWGRQRQALLILSYILENYEIPVVIDADALNALSENTDMLSKSKSKVILTPHIGEFSRLSKLSIDAIINSPIDAAKSFAEKYNLILLLKGTSTVITDGSRVYICDRGAAGMATAGSGDVLSGILAGLFGYSKEEALLTVACAAYINGCAGELAQLEFGAISMTSSDTVSKIKEIVKNLS